MSAPREDCGLIERDVNYFPYASVYIGGGETVLRTDTLQNVAFSFKGLEVNIIETQLGPTEDKLPKDFSGASGGGVYQTTAHQIGDQFKKEEILLAGVFVAGNEEAGLALFQRSYRFIRYILSFFRSSAG